MFSDAPPTSKRKKWGLTAFVAVLTLAALQLTSCKPTTQPIELSNNQIGFSSQTDQRQYLDIADQKLPFLGSSHIWRLPQQNNQTGYNISWPLHNQTNNLVRLLTNEPGSTHE